MSKKKKTAAALAILAGLAALFGLASSAKAADDDDDDRPWTGPDPGKPGGPKKPKKPSGGDKRPTHVNPDDLWISPTCDDLIIGEQWMEETAGPAIREWLDMGYGAPIDAFDGDIKAAVQYSAAAVTRGIVGPYAPLCVDAYPWADVYEKNYPKPQWDPPAGEELQAWADELAARKEQWANDAPAFTQLLIDLETAVLAAWQQENP